MCSKTAGKMPAPPGLSLGFLWLGSLACYDFGIAAVRFCPFVKVGGIDALVSTLCLLVRRTCYRCVDCAARFRVCRGYASAKIGEDHRAEGYCQRPTGSLEGRAGQESDDHAHCGPSESFRPPDARPEKWPPLRRAGRQQVDRSL